ncbi:heterogeneous nuclear ribonucleoprotein HRP1 [Lentinula aciculospora]|uniref:Heterogeneous nuclear ribonucleoprotein HRP1 n=1 Tax=Lentinula aciculospora TaxID=153920 RepID=A0A9W9AM69_9AGAR|nr:heterogeneous nuclear ribonucleoprotein HRP1 [Lentinula aciculospora]
MSDIDADLYGDLYETDFADQTVDEKLPEPPKQQSEPMTEAVVTPKPAETVQSAISNTNLTPATYGSSSVPTPILSSLQQIPTYEDVSNDYAQPRLGGIQSIATSEQRPVRPSEMKDDGKMFIGGLHWDTTDDGLRAYFEQFGRVEACTIMRDQAGRSRCFAFLTFEDAASVNAVMVKEHVLDGKIIDPKRAIPRQEHQRATKLFIGGLAATVTSESMREFFSQFGRVVDSTVMLDRETGRSKGFGFVSLEDANVQQFLGFGNLEIDGKLIDVKLAQPRFQREHFQEDDQSGGSDGGFNNRAAGGYTNSFQGGGGATAAGGNFNMAPTGGSSFDPQALAALYTRMFQMAGGGGMNMMPMMMMNNMGGRGMGMASSMGNMGVGRGGMPTGASAGAGAGMGQVPRGPRGNLNGPGPARSQRGQHNYHPYGR